MGIRRRILLAFLLLFAVVFLTTAIASTLLIANAVEHRLAAQTKDLVSLIDKLQPTMLRLSLERLLVLQGAESIRVGELTVGSVGNPGDRVFRAPTRHGELSVVYTPEVISREKSEAFRPFAIMAVAGLGLVVVFGYLTAQAIARPLERLAEQAKALPAGDVARVGGGAELDHLVDAMNRMLAEVRRAERLAVMGRMAAGVAHEIRNPLSAMKMTVQMLRQGVKEVEPYDVILREIERLELTAAELVGVSQPLRKERVKLDAVVDEVLELMRRQLEHLSVRVEKRFAPAPEVAVDVARFKRCVMNLVLNGAQAMPSGGPLRVGVEARNGRVRLEVSDEGPGIPPEVRDRVFEPFVTTKQDGVGLGLSLTKRIVEDHGGAIGFEPAERGTTFWIELPGN
jgi:signal transduction histidine kinase